jgi:hypothetical protein
VWLHRLLSKTFEKFGDHCLLGFDSVEICSGCKEPPLLIGYVVV